eukprot:gene5499-biopygen4230
MSPSLNIIRFASTINADFIFLDAQPSLGVLVLPASASLGSMVEAISQLQSTFTNSCVIVHGYLSDDKFTSLQLGLPFGSVRFYTSPTTEAGHKLRCDLSQHLIYVTVKQRRMWLSCTPDILQKSEMKESANVLSAGTARDVLFESHRYMNIPPLDTELITSAFPSLSKFMGTDHARIHFQLPCEASTAQVLSNFFNASVQLPPHHNGCGEPAVHSAASTAPAQVRDTHPRGREEEGVSRDSSNSKTRRIYE